MHPRPPRFCLSAVQRSTAIALGTLLLIAACGRVPESNPSPVVPSSPAPSALAPAAPADVLAPLVAPPGDAGQPATAEAPDAADTSASAQAAPLEGDVVQPPVVAPVAELPRPLAPYPTAGDTSPDAEARALFRSARAALSAATPPTREEAVALGQRLSAVSDGALRPLRAAVEVLEAKAALLAGAPERAAELLTRGAEGPPEPAPTSVETERLDVLADALERMGKRDAAADARVQRSAQAPGTDAAVRAVNALQAAGRTREAARLLRAYEVRYGPVPKERLPTLPEGLTALTHEELVAQLEPLAAAGRTGALMESLERVRASRLATAETRCLAAALEAKALSRARRHTALVGAARRLESACAAPPGPPGTPRAAAQRARRAAEVAWYLGKAYRAKKRVDDAASAFRRVAELAPSSPLADDALLARALLKRAAGDEPSAERNLSAAMATGGDLAEEAAFQWFWGFWSRGELEKAQTAADQALSKLPASAVSLSRGRLPYWRARTLERREAPAADAYRDVVTRYPLTWYAQLAEARLQAAGEALPALPTESPTAPPEQRFAEALQRPDVAAAIELLRLGEPQLDDLRDAVEALPDGQWLLAWVAGQVAQDSTAYRTLRWGLSEDYATRPPVGEDAPWWVLAHPRPEAFCQHVDDFAKANTVDPAYVWAIIQTESGYQAKARSAAKARGLMQLIQPTAEAMAKREGLATPRSADLDDPKTNIRLGTRYLRRLRELVGDDAVLMAAGYNAGPGRPRRWLEERIGAELDEFVENIPYRETRRYVKSVMTAYARYKWLYEGCRTPALSLSLPPAG